MGARRRSEETARRGRADGERNNACATRRDSWPCLTPTLTDPVDTLTHTSYASRDTWHGTIYIHVSRFKYHMWVTSLPAGYRRANRVAELCNHHGTRIPGRIFGDAHSVERGFMFGPWSSRAWPSDPTGCWSPRRRAAIPISVRSKVPIEH